MALVGGKRRQKKKKRMTKNKNKTPTNNNKKKLHSLMRFSFCLWGCRQTLNARMNPLIQVTMSGMATALAMHSCVNELARDSTVERKPQHRKLPEM